MKKNLLLLLTIFISLSVYSQKNEMGITLGTSKFNGDFHNKLGIHDFKPALGIFYRNHYHSNLAVRASFQFATLTSSDAKNNTYSQNQIQEKIRGLSFSSHIYEFSIVNEFYLVKTSSEKKFSPYVFLGAGILHFNPTAVYDGSKYNLRDYHTEGQGSPGYEKEYKLNTLTGILGLGARIKLNSSFCLGFEYGYRFTHSDYIDDIHGNYADPSTLETKDGITSVKLSDRSSEVAAKDPLLESYIDYSIKQYNDANGNPHVNGYGSVNDKRAINSRNDRYLIFNLSLSYIF